MTILIVDSRACIRFQFGAVDAENARLCTADFMLALSQDLSAYELTSCRL